MWNGAVLAESDHTVRVEGNYYFPPDSLRWRYLQDSPTRSRCPWKGRAGYYTVVVDGRENADAAWCYARPSLLARKIAGHVAFWHGVEVFDDTAEARRSRRGRNSSRLSGDEREGLEHGGAVVVGLAVALIAAVAAGSLVYAWKGSSPSHAPLSVSPTPSSPSDPVSVDVQPADGAVDVPLDSAVAVTAAAGHLRLVQVLSPAGTVVAGTFDPTGQRWQSTAALAPRAAYTVSVEAAGRSGRPVQQVSHFQTLAPAATLGVNILPGDGMSVGVGMPIELRFDHPVANKAALLSRLQVTESVPVPGGWHWFSDRELHFRPQQYWPAGEQVTLAAALAGFDAGLGIWATEDHSVHFAVGDARVSTANVTTHELTMTENGHIVATYPLSAGRTEYPTMNGVHIVLYRQQDVLMDSATVGIPRSSPDGYYEHVYWDVAITDGGEFVHAAPWSLGAQGSSNVSHGCINLSPANATAFFDFSRIGDLVEVVGSPRPPSLGDHGTMDWNTPWDEWTLSSR